MLHDAFVLSVKLNCHVDSGLVSRTLGLVVDIEVDFSEGFGRAPKRVRIVKTIGNLNKDSVMRIVKGVQAGPEFVKELALNIKLYFKGMEEKKEMLKKK